MHEIGGGGGGSDDGGLSGGVSPSDVCLPNVAEVWYQAFLKVLADVCL